MQLPNQRFFVWFLSSIFPSMTPGFLEVETMDRNGGLYLLHTRVFWHWFRYIRTDLDCRPDYWGWWARSVSRFKNFWYEGLPKLIWVFQVEPWPEVKSSKIGTYLFWFDQNQCCQGTKWKGLNLVAKPKWKWRKWDYIYIYDFLHRRTDCHHITIWLLNFRID